MLCELDDQVSVGPRPLSSDQALREVQSGACGLRFRWRGLPGLVERGAQPQHLHFPFRPSSFYGQTRGEERDGTRQLAFNHLYNERAASPPFPTPRPAAPRRPSRAITARCLSLGQGPDPTWVAGVAPRRATNGARIRDPGHQAEQVQCRECICRICRAPRPHAN